MPVIDLETPDGPLPTLLTVPDGEGPWPGVVVVHDVYGLTDHVRANSRRIADAGYLVATPGLYRRGGPRCVTRVLREMLTGRGRAFSDLAAVREQLRARPDCTGSVGVAGFCMGGQFALLTAADGFAVAAPFYPVPLPKGLDEALAGACPVVASLGERDPLGRGAGPRLAAALERAGVEHDAVAYPGVGHAFAERLPLQRVQRVIGFGYDEAATEDAWRRVFGFFDRHLGAGAGSADGDGDGEAGA